MTEKELERLWASVSPLVEKMKAKYPKELNLDGLEPALTHDICMIVKERDERLKEAVRDLTPFGIGIPQDPLVSREAIINIIDNHA